MSLAQWFKTDGGVRACLPYAKLRTVAPAADGDNIQLSSTSRCLVNLKDTTGGGDSQRHLGSFRSRQAQPAGGP
jgi:hypothetical protein